MKTISLTMLALFSIGLAACGDETTGQSKETTSAFAPDEATPAGEIGKGNSEKAPEPTAVPEPTKPPEPTLPVSIESVALALDFNEPITYEVQFIGQYDKKGQLQKNDDTALVALFYRAGLIRKEMSDRPAPVIASFFRYSSVTGPFPVLSIVEPLRVNTSNELLGGVIFPIGYRQVTSHDNIKRWNEGATEYAAATVHYTVNPIEELREAITGSVGDFSYRLVLINDPAVGQWQIQTGRGRGTTTFNIYEESQELRPLLDQAGSEYVDSLFE